MTGTAAASEIEATFAMVRKWRFASSKPMQRAISTATGPRLWIRRRRLRGRGRTEAPEEAKDG